MASMHDLIEQIEDKRERERFRQVWEESIREKKFGLVFEPHLPELLPLPKVKPRRGDLVCMREGSLKDLWRVRRVANGAAFCVKPGAEGQGGPVDPVQFSLDELLVVRQFGEPIFPALVPVDQVQNGEVGVPWHTLIEADNFHALQLLDYLYAGKVDCIYIDPPYNTGARDWKYNNDYVDKNDAWRHSKWLAFMERRLQQAKRLLNPASGVLICMIDDNEVHHLRCQLEAIFPAHEHFTIVIEHNKRGRQGEEFAKTHEYALVVTPSVPGAIGEQPADGVLGGETRNLRRTGNNSLRTRREGQFYPIWVDRETLKVVEVGEPLGAGLSRDSVQSRPGLVPAWPIDNDGVERNWHYAPGRTKRELGLGKVFAKRRKGQVNIYYTLREKDSKRWKTVWSYPLLDASTHGTEMLTTILGRTSAFSFPKSLYATKECIATAVLHRRDALVVDFFAGSGTTLHAVNMLNAQDGGKRRCIVVTNNEVSAVEAEEMRGRGVQPGDDEWERMGICRSVTWPRSKFAILGRRDDGSEIGGYVFTGDRVEKEKARSFAHVGFATPSVFVSKADDPDKVKRRTLAYQKQLIALTKLPQSHLKEPSSFLVSAEHSESVLFDIDAAEDWLLALDGQDHVTDFYIVAETKKQFESLKEKVVDLLGPQIVAEEERRAMSDGLSANLAYFRLEFLDKDRVALKQAFKEVLPLLWLKAGAVGPRPELPRGATEPPFFDPPGTNFAVLLDEGAFRKFVKAVGKRTDLGVVYIVTDADEAFKDMADEVRQALRLTSPNVEVVQLYKDYLANFLINTRLDHDLNGQGGQA